MASVIDCDIHKKAVCHFLLDAYPWPYTWNVLHDWIELLSILHEEWNSLHGDHVHLSVNYGQWQNQLSDVGIGILYRSVKPTWVPWGLADCRAWEEDVNEFIPVLSKLCGWFGWNLCRKSPHIVT